MATQERATGRPCCARRGGESVRSERHERRATSPAPAVLLALSGADICNRISTQCMIGSDRLCVQNSAVRCSVIGRRLVDIFEAHIVVIWIQRFCPCLSPFPYRYHYRYQDTLSRPPMNKNRRLYKNILLLNTECFTAFSPRFHIHLSFCSTCRPYERSCRFCAFVTRLVSSSFI